MTQRAIAGRVTYARIFGLDEAEAAAAMAPRVGSAYTQEVFAVAGGQGWQSPAITDRDRSVKVISTLVSQHVVDERLMTYLSSARRSGLDREGLAALMILLTAYVGQPYASAAMAAAHRAGLFTECRLNEIAWSC